MTEEDVRQSERVGNSRYVIVLDLEVSEIQLSIFFLFNI